MKITIVIPTFNRPAYLRQCLDSLKRSDLKGAEVLIIDDGSKDPETLQLIYSADCVLIRHKENRGICRVLHEGINAAFVLGADVVINLDSDAIVRNDWVEVLLQLHETFPNDIITGFHSTTKNKDGSERHQIIEAGAQKWWNDQLVHPLPAYCRKKSVGGINMLFTKRTYEKFAKPALEKCFNGGNWDHQTCINAGSIICSIPSVIQHIGLQSSLGHMHDLPDVADDFKGLHLPNVTLVCVDDRKQRADPAIDESLRNIAFGQVVRIHPEGSIGSKEAYSKFILTNLHEYIHTDYALIVQHDGYVKNWQAWTDDFLKYDYIGAPWWYKDGMNVGNGGFSLRSKKLLEMTAKMDFKETHPEDHVICRTYRKELEAKGIKFAPEELAAKFSYEGWNQPGQWERQFGFHGPIALRKKPDPKKTGFIINQFLGLGDILFLVPLVRKWIDEGHDILWPVADEYFDLKEYFPDIQFVKKSQFPMNYEHRTDFMHRWQYGVYQVKSLRWNMTRSISEAMTSKYTMYGEDWKLWRTLSWKRNYDKERKLMDLVGANGGYRFVCTEFGNITDGGTDFKIIGPIIQNEFNEPLAHISLQRIPGYSLLDWAGVIENASEIHAVSSSTFYLFELLDLKAKEIHLYSRKLGQKDFTYIEKLFTKNYTLHV